MKEVTLASENFIKEVGEKIELICNNPSFTGTYTNTSDKHL
jgi:hypothetical protein